MQPSASPLLQKCRPLLDSLTERITAYLRADRDQPRQWLPRPDPDGTPRWTTDEESELRSLDIPALPTPENAPYDPDLVLYCAGRLESLDNAFSNRLESVMESESHSLIVNASGTGKTRLLFEVLSRSWGLYFTCYTHRVTSPYGSVDITKLLDDLASFRIDGQALHDVLILKGQGSHSSKQYLVHNQLIAHTLIHSVLLARLLIFNHFISIGTSLCIPEDVLRRRWLLLQLRPHDLVQSEIFGILSRDLKYFPLDQIVAETRAAAAICNDRLRFVALDEAQIAMSSFDAAFATSKGKTWAPILREFVRCMASSFTEQRILVAGTHVGMNVVVDAISGVRSRYSNFKLVYSLGCFDTVSKTTNYLRHFFGQTFSDEDCAEVHSLLQGRHRFLAVFVSHVLVEGFREMDRVMNSLHQLLTGYSRPGTRFIRLPYELIIRDSQLDDCLLKRQARQATFRFALLQEGTVFLEEAVDIVRLGLGLFCDPDASARIFEPLVFYRLVSWLLNSRRADITALIRHKVLVPSVPVRGIDFAAGLATCLWTAFSGLGRELDYSLTFQGRPPFWGSHKAKLALPSSFNASTRDEWPLEHALSVARQPEDVFKWLRAGQQPFVIPDSQFGADLLFFLHVEDIGTILVTVFTDPFAADRPHRTLTVSPKEPTSFYPNSPCDQEKLLSILRDSPALPFSLATARTQAHVVRFNVLRVLCFTRALKRPKPYNPPVACIDMDSLLKLQHAPELAFSYLDDIVWGPFT